jgi:serine/threonine protein kinase
VASVPSQRETRLVGDRYTLTRRLGSGGLGTVWLAIDGKTGQKVAIKELHLLPATERDVLRLRFEREISATKRLAGHPNIVAILDVFWEDDRPWIVMEYVSRQSLQDVISREGRIPPWRSAWIGTQVLDALQAAHAAGVLHRDVKPSNILLTTDRAVLTDFGIAQLQDHTTITETGVIVGSVGYLAPERINGERPGPASDLWALGATLYTAVEGTPPFQRNSVMETFTATMNEPVPPPIHAGPLEPVLLGLLARDPRERMLAREAARLLEEIAAPPGPAIEGVSLDRAIGESAWLAHDENGQSLAVRLLPKGSAPPDTAPLEGVVPVREVGELPDGRPYIVTEHPGTPVAELTGPPGETLRLVAEVARRVAAVNAAGAHYVRLGPDEVLRTDEDVILLPVPDVLDAQAKPKSDVHALGELAHRLVTGRRDTAITLAALTGLVSDEAVEVIGRALYWAWPDATAFADALESVADASPEAGSAPPRTDYVPPPPREPVMTGGGAGDREIPSGYWDFPLGRHDQTITREAGLPAAQQPRARPQRRLLVPFWGTRRRRTPEPPVTVEQPVSARPDEAVLYAPLREEFRYVHEPLRLGDEALPLLGNEPLIQALTERLANSYGGTFLVTGFRGVGKSTLVEHALAAIAASHPRGRRVLPVVLSVARPMTTERLLFAIVRRVFEELTEAGVLDSLPPATRHSLVLAYMRTSLSFKETRADALERTASLDLDPAKMTRGLLGPAGIAIPKAGMSTKRSRSLATEAAFLAYSETDVEHDMTRIIRMLSAAPPPRKWWGRRRTPLDLQLVVVLDEVDKLTALQDGLDTVERLLSGIKNVVTMRGAHYVVVAGPDLHDRVVRESGRGNSIYESIFAWRTYVPCNWAAPARLLEELGLPPGDGGLAPEFEKYLRYRSRGVLRRLLQELNSFVVWEDARRPYLRIGARSRETIASYARLERSLDAFFAATRRKIGPAPLDQDRWRLAAYYVMDWILRSEGRPFTSADVIQDEEFDPLLRVSQAGVELLLEHLADQGILVVVREPTRATSTLIPDVAEAQRPSYQLDDALLDRLAGESPRGEADRPIETLAGDRYELWRLIGEGGTSSVYEGEDTLLHRPVAVKLLRTALRGDPRARSRFLREAMIAAAVHHPNVVDVYEVVTSPDEPGRRYAIVMELISGPTLNELLNRDGALPARQAAALGVTLAGALDYLAGKGLARLDLKPHNIVLSPARGPVIIDLGIAKIVENAQAWPLSDEEAENADPATQLGIVIGTPAYLSPEQARGEEIDIRSDIYALGLVLCTCLAGRHPYGDLEPMAVMARAMTGGLDTSGLPCSEELRRVLTRATEPDSSARFARPADLAAALRATPEVTAS